MLRKKLGNYKMKILKTYEEFDFDFFSKKIPPEYKEVYNAIKKIFKGAKIEYDSNYKELGTSEPIDRIIVKGKTEDDDFILKRNGFEKRRYSGSAHFEFDLTNNLEKILKWAEGYKPTTKITKDDPYGEEDWNDRKPEKSQLQDFIDNFDIYQGEGSIEPTDENPYTFWNDD